MWLNSHDRKWLNFKRPLTREAGYTQKEVSTGLNVSRIAVRNSLQRAGKYLDTCADNVII